MKNRKMMGIIGGIAAVIVIGVVFAQVFLFEEKRNPNYRIPLPEGSDYEPFPREWQTSGPFQIDKKQYALGENIFLVVSDLGPEDKGQISVLRPLNDTHYSVYMTIPFGDKPSFNQYFQPDLTSLRDICTIDDLVGNWTLVFQGTDYENIKFEVVDIIVPGDEPYYEPVC